MNNILNFDAGPAALPQDVLAEASEAIKNYNNSGLSILEISHRGAAFKAILEEANALVRKLMRIGDDYEVMWMQGGGRLQFAMLPMNFLKSQQDKGGYVDSGHWASEALQHGSYYGNVLNVASTKDSSYKSVPPVRNIPQDLSYLHVTTNNTIYGTQMRKFPVTEAPLVADMSSDIFSRNLDFSQFSLIYAVAQKNLGSTGSTLVVARKSFLEKAKNELPPLLSYKEMAAQNSLVNTAPVFAIYTCLLTLRWIDKMGLQNLELQNILKAQLLYDVLTESRIFKTVVQEESRSNMNVCFVCQDESLTASFIDFAKQHHIVGIKGHRSVGGFRVSLYNAISLEQVKILINVMKEFEEAHRK